MTCNFALRHLCPAAAKAQLTAAGAVPAISQLLRRQQSPVVPEAAAALVCLLAEGDHALTAEFVAAGVVPSLLALAVTSRGSLPASDIDALRFLADNYSLELTGCCSGGSRSIRSSGGGPWEKPACKVRLRHARTLLAHAVLGRAAQCQMMLAAQNTPPCYFNCFTLWPLLQMRPPC